MSPVNLHYLYPGSLRKRWINKVNTSTCVKWCTEDEGDELNRGHHLESMITEPRKPGGLTCAVCTWGDWMTDDCADWITPWTWNWPPGSCTTATEEPPSDIYKNPNTTLNPQNTAYLSWQLHSIEFNSTLFRFKKIIFFKKKGSFFA